MYEHIQQVLTSDVKPPGIMVQCNAQTADGSEYFLALRFLHEKSSGNILGRYSR